MKTIFSLVVLLSAGFVFVGCESDMPPKPSDAEAKLRRGITGGGTIIPVDHANDPLIDETARPTYQGN